MGTLGLNEQIAAESASKLTGGRVNYYLAQVDHPQREEQPAYQAECEDIIAALNMDFNEACEFKAIWRTAAARLGNGKAGQKAKYDAEKRVHYARRSLRALELADGQAQEPQPKDSNPRTWWEWSGSQSGGGPAPARMRVEIKRRDGNTAKGLTDNFDWKHREGGLAPSDIVGWRHADQ